MITIALLDPQTQNAIQKWTFTDSSIVRVGRASNNEIVLDRFGEVSRHHLELRKIPTTARKLEWQLFARGTNGTFLNGKLVSHALVPDKALIQLARDGPLLHVKLVEAVAPSGSDPLPNRPGNRCDHAGTPSNSLFCVRCGQPLVEKEQFVRHYQVLRVIGRGGMGTTYLAWDKTGSLCGQPQTFVLKEMNADMALVDKARELFEREARVLRELDHPGIPQYYDFFLEGSKKYLAMELIHGRNLEQCIYETGPVTPHQAIEWMIQTCDILSYLHSLTPPLVHRDVKPANLMVRSLDNRIVLLDFGAVKEIGTPMGTCIGAEGYSAPEQDRGQPCPQSDLYAIGPTLTYLLSGESPLKYYRYQEKQYRLNVAGIPTIAPPLRQVIEKASEPSLHHRYHTARELAQALANCD
ncbi:MAG: protein kinase [Cyanobacteriota bacterium]|nr:protein kinase [Cyanobacteriota bacterium]